MEKCLHIMGILFLLLILLLMASGFSDYLGVDTSCRRIDPKKNLFTLNVVSLKFLAWDL